MTAIHRANRVRRARSQRPERLLSWSSAYPVDIPSTVPGWCSDPDAAAATKSGGGRACVTLVHEQSVDGGTCAADVGAERAVRTEVVCERRGDEVIRGQSGEINRPAHILQRSQQLRAAFGEAVDPIERRIDRRGRFLASIVGQDEHDPEVLRQLEWLQLAAVPGRELRSALQEERNVCPELGGKGVKPIARQRV